MEYIQLDGQPFIELDDNLYCAMWEDIETNAQDVRCYEPPVGYQAQADLTDINPVTGEQLDCSQWVIYLTPVEEQD